MFLKWVSVKLLTVAVFSSFAIHASEIKLDQDQEWPTLSAQRGKFVARYIQDGDQGTINQLASQSYQEGLPDDSMKWAENLIQRRNNKNFYSCLIVQNQDTSEAVAALGFGRMPVLGYDPKHTEILDTYMQFGVIRQISSEQGYAKDNFERVGHFGIGTMLPIIPLNLEKDDRVNILQLGSEVFQVLQQKGKVLPIENTIPHDLIGLFHPTDKLVEDFIDINFDVIDKPGFFGFYDKPRVMVHKSLS